MAMSDSFKALFGRSRNQQAAAAQQQPQEPALVQRPAPPEFTSDDSKELQEEIDQRQDKEAQRRLKLFSELSSTNRQMIIDDVRMQQFIEEFNADTIPHSLKETELRRKEMDWEHYNRAQAYYQNGMSVPRHPLPMFAAEPKHCDLLNFHPRFHLYYDSKITIEKLEKIHMDKCLEEGLLDTDTESKDQ